jgi:hypothetical protein
MHPGTHTIWPGLCIEKTELVIKRFKWIWENNPMFPDYNDDLSLTTLNPLKESTIITITCINQEERQFKEKQNYN